MHECAYCAKEFKYESEKKRHEISHIPQFECKECCKKFSYGCALKRHQKQHERMCSVMCEDCGRNFRDEACLKRHIKYAHKDIKVCPQCSSTFNSALALSSHMLSHKPKAERRFKCKYIGCTKLFNFTHHLKHHEMTHTNQKQHFCKICGKGFIQSHHLKSHLKAHSSDDVLYSPEKLIGTHRTIIDRGISSDSICDNSKDSIKDSKFFRPIKISLIESNKKKRKIKQENAEDLSLKLLSSTEFNYNDKQVKPDLNYCDAVTGGCIANGDSSENNCLCAQIKMEVAFPDIASPIEPINGKHELIPIESLGDKVVNNSCGGCDCSSKKVCNLSTKKRDYEDDIPQIEYRSGGVIKLEDTFDIDITKINTHIEKPLKVAKNSDVLKLKDVPYNSCQAVLGRCIASGNGTMSEDCLCAKMALDDQTIISQEIDEITPQPNVSTG